MSFNKHPEESIQCLEGVDEAAVAKVISKLLCASAQGNFPICREQLSYNFTMHLFVSLLQSFKIELSFWSINLVFHPQSCRLSTSSLMITLRNLM